MCSLRHRCERIASVAELNISPQSDPLAVMGQWLAQAAGSVAVNHNAGCLATVDAGGMPDARYVLVKAVDGQGAHFFTNRDSDKGRQLQENAGAALAMYWREQARQLRCRGRVTELDREQVAGYFATRSRQSRIGAWASRQSRPLEGMDRLRADCRQQEQMHADREVLLPDHWTGFCLVPEQVEFWQEGEHRLHERIRFRRPDADGRWSCERLYP